MHFARARARGEERCYAIAHLSTAESENELVRDLAYLSLVSVVTVASVRVCESDSECVLVCVRDGINRRSSLSLSGRLSAVHFSHYNIPTSSCGFRFWFPLFVIEQPSLSLSSLTLPLLAFKIRQIPQKKKGFPNIPKLQNLIL